MTDHQCMGDMASSRNGVHGRKCYVSGFRSQKWTIQHSITDTIAQQYRYTPRMERGASIIALYYKS